MLEEICTITFKILLTVVLSGLIGMERTVHNKVAGLRTHVLVGVGSALIVLTSYYIFDIYKDVTLVDPTRMIAGIVTGIGFLCAGTIMSSGGQISGLTTAAALWTVSGIGMAVGAGYYLGACIVSIVVFVVLSFARSFERLMGEKLKDIL